MISSILCYMTTEQIEYIIPKRVLVIAAHPDDIDFGTAGSVARWTREGATVTYCIITDGSAGSNEPNTDLEELVKIRQDEQRAAAAVVGVDDVRFLGYKDGILEPTLDLRRSLTRIIREVKPDRVVCQDPTTTLAGTVYINHPDHRAAGEAAIYAVFPSAETRPVFPELLAEGFEPHHVDEVYLNLTLEPNFRLDITETIDLKMKALLCHRSQVTEETANWMRERNAEAGQEIGCGYAEVFRVMQFFRDRP